MNQTRKEREREFRRNEILNAAVEIFAAKGYTHTTLDEVAEASEFGKGTLYNYFRNKEELYNAILERIFEDFIKSLEQIDADTKDFKTFARGIIDYMLDFSINKKPEFIILTHKRMGAIHDDPSSAAQRIKSLLDKAHSIQINKIENSVKAGELKKLDPERIVILLRGMVFSFAYSLISCSGEEEFDKDSETDFLLSVILNGINKTN